jgi:hypothetical protein
MEDKSRQKYKRLDFLLFNFWYGLATGERLSDRQNETCINILKKIVKRAGPLAEHVTHSRACAQQYYMRNLNNLSLYKCRTECFKNSFFPRAIAELNAMK